ncbi:aromatic amino acid DMT transporter YddG [Acinetobacter lwoffii]|jgi:drug/metabolite transporter (DMT)-like permease|uniref:aromatic amino acid DMT transporter YddG n=1 Tax=Acinetobacter lwoffii TaxID=28090 RepID=UPI003F900417
MKIWSVNLATWIGLSSILIWASLVAVVKLITESTSAVQGIALIYSFSSLAIFAFTGFPKITQMSKRYLLGCGALFVAYEILFLVAVAWSDNREQVMLIAMINYLWPPLMIVFSIFARQLQARLWVIPGFLLAVMGLMLVVNPEITNLPKFMQVLAENPWAYGFAFLGALLWPCYCVLTRTYGRGQNGVPIFFLVAVISLWFLHLGLNEPFIMPTFKLWLGIAVVGSLIGIAYSNWNQSMQFGNIKVLILATYFMPILSSVMSMLILDVRPELSFWIGTGLVTAGAIVCWKSTAIS